jgi:hypothetical protein
VTNEKSHVTSDRPRTTPPTRIARLKPFDTTGSARQIAVKWNVYNTRLRCRYQ